MNSAKLCPPLPYLPTAFLFLSSFKPVGFSLVFYRCFFKQLLQGLLVRWPGEMTESLIFLCLQLLYRVQSRYRICLSFRGVLFQKWITERVDLVFQVLALVCKIHQICIFLLLKEIRNSVDILKLVVYLVFACISLESIE